MGLLSTRNQRNQFSKSLRSLLPRNQRSHFQKSRQSLQRTNLQGLQNHQQSHSQTIRWQLQIIQEWQVEGHRDPWALVQLEEFQWRTLACHLSWNLQNPPPKNRQSLSQTNDQDPRMLQQNLLPRNRQNHFQTIQQYRRRCLGFKYWLHWLMRGCLQPSSFCLCSLLIVCVCKW